MSNPYGGIPPEMLSAIQSNPELMGLISKPGMMEKIQRLMSDPSSAAGAMGDPDIMRLMQLMQGLPGAGGMGGGMGGMGGMGGGGGGQAPIGKADVIEIKDNDHFNRVLSEAGEKLVVVDFYATWCGPCQQIKPAVQELANMYAAKAVFCKVDVDRNKPLSQAKGVSAMPTFHFYRKGNKLDELKGANQQKLTSLVGMYSDLPKAKAKPSPYRHFPARIEELVTYKKIKYDPIEQHIKKFSAEMAEGKETENVHALSESEVANLEKLIATLKDGSKYHSSKFSDGEYAVINKLLEWPVTRLPPVLNLVRGLITHPEAAKHYAQTDFCIRVSSLMGTGEHSSNALAILRFVLNCFNRHLLCKKITEDYEEVLNTIAPAAQAQKRTIRLAYISAMLNFSLQFRRDPKRFSEAKILVMSALTEVLSLEKDENAVYRGIVVIGTLIFRDEEVTEMAKSLDFGETLERLVQEHPESAKVKESVDEILRAFENPQL